MVGVDLKHLHGVLMPKGGGHEWELFDASRSYFYIPHACHTYPLETISMFITLSTPY
jgi:hypothetical protein